MKKITVFTVVASILISSILISKPAHAEIHTVIAKSGGVKCSDGGSFDPAKITVLAGDTIKFVVPPNDPYTAGLEIHNFPGGNFTLRPGESHITPALLISVPNYYSIAQPGCQKATGEVIIQPASNASLTPSPLPPPPPPPPVLLPPVAPKINLAPSALKVENVMVDGEKADLSKPLQVEYSKTITLSGYTIANGVINITIHSIVRNELARANDSGYWSFVISDLESGSHTVEATVTNLATKQTSEKATLLKFAIIGTPKSANALNGGAPAAVVGGNKQNPTLIAGVAVLVLCISVFAATVGIKNRRKKPHDHIIPATLPVEFSPTSLSANTITQPENT
jgi:hypothetical protein